MQPERKVQPLPAPDRLDSWKEIAAYLNRTERTVRRWEDTEDLPVHRLQHDKRGSVYAYTRELDAWRVSRRVVEETADEVPTKRLHPGWWAGGALVLVVVVIAIGISLDVRAEDARIAERGTANEEAWQAFQRARFGDNAGRVQIETGIRYYQQAIRLDPEFAQAWVGLATAHTALTWFGEQPAADTMQEARREAGEARRLDASLSGSWRVLGYVSHYVDWNHQEAEGHFRRAIALDPADAGAQSWYGDFLLDMRRFDEARAAYKRAQAANPRWLEPPIFAANVDTLTGQPARAILEQRRTLETEPNYGLGNHFLGRAYLASGDWTQALQHLRKSNALMGAVPFSLGDLGHALAVSGQRDEAVRMRDELVARRAKGYYPAFPIAAIEAGLGNTDAALDWLELAVGERHTGFYFPSADSIYDRIRTEPRFRDLMARMNLPTP